MLKKLRGNLTMLCACMTGIIVLAIAVVFLVTSEQQTRQQGGINFESNVNTVVYRLQSDQVLLWSWMAQTEASNRMLIHIEENSSASLFSGVWKKGAERDGLVLAVQEIAYTLYGVDVTERPMSGLLSNRAFFTFSSEDGITYQGGVVVFRTASGYQSLTAVGDMSQELLDIRRQRILLGVIYALGMAILVWFSWWFSGRAIRPVAESRRRQSEFIAAASHELRTPLTVIRASAAALRWEHENGRFVDTIERECIRMGRLVDDLLVLANVDASSWSVQMEPVELDMLLRELAVDFSAAAAEKGQTLALDLPQSALPLLAGDSQRLRQTLVILIDNALRFTPENGRIVLRGMRAYRGVRIEVSDNGCGIPDEQKKKVFERFYRADASRTKKEHYGLGLSIAWEIVRLHDGTITLADTPGGGLTVRIDLPVKEIR